MVRQAVIVDVVRSPFGRAREGGALVSLHPVNLYAHVLAALVERNQLEPELIDDVITGCVIQVGEQSGNIGRQVVLAANFPESVPALTIDRKCGSAQQALDFAAQGVIAGAYDVVIAGGVEMMSLVPVRVNRMEGQRGQRVSPALPRGPCASRDLSRGSPRNGISTVKLRTAIPYARTSAPRRIEMILHAISRQSTLNKVTVRP
jgi:acetyl-CoA acetyltransferase